MAVKPTKAMTAAHAAGIFADMTLDGPEIGTLIAVIDRAKNLPNRKTMGKQNPYCAMRLGKEAKKTETDKRGGQTPKWDQELRFIVHESPDYYKLKCSVFNDDKKTDLIGEAWINLSDLIKPGGGSNDLWHQLNYKGKYAGDIRIELTYYDVRPREEKPQEKRRTREKGSSSSADASGPVVGPRQLGPRDLRRRPLPTSPASASPIQTTPISTPQEETPPPSVRTSQGHSSVQQSVPVCTQQFPVQPSVAADQHSFDIYDDDDGAIMPQIPQQQYRQPYYEDQPYTPNMETSNAFDMATEYGGEQQYTDAGHQMMVRRSPSPLPQTAWSDQAEAWNQPSSREFEQYSSANSTFQNSPRALPSPPVHPESSLPRLHRSSLSHPKSSSFHSPLRQSMNHQDLSPEIVHEPESFDALPPPPPKHRETTPRRQQPDYPPSSFGHHEPGQNQYNSQSNHSTPRRRSVDERSPLQSIEREFDQFMNSEAVMTQSVKRRSFRESYQEDYGDRRQSHSNRSDIQVPERQSSYDSYQTPSLEYVDSNVHHQIDHAATSLVRHERRPEQRIRSGSYDDRYSSSDSAQQVPQLSGHAAYSISQPDLTTTTYHRPQPVRPKPQYQTQTPPRKAVNTGPYPEPASRRMSNNPFDPDAYDVLNPASSPITNENTIFQTPEQAKEAARIRLSKNVQNDEPIIGNDGRVIDPSDHLPSDTWAPEPEKKQRKPEHVIHYRTRNEIRSSGTSNSAPQPTRHNHQSRQRQSQSTPMSSPASGTPPGGRNHLQKLPSPTRPLPQQPYRMALPEPKPPVNPANQQALQRYSYQGASPSIHRPSLSEYQVPIGNNYSDRRSSYRSDDVAAVPAQPQFDMHTGNGYGPSYTNGYHDSLAAEMSMIDIGPSRGSRAMVRAGQRF